MLQFGFSANKKLFGAALAVIALILLPARAAYADQFSYVFTGDVGGVFDGFIPFDNTPFSLTIDENTSSLINQGSGYYKYTGVDALLQLGIFDFTLTNVTLEVNGTAGFQNVDFYDSTFTNGLGLAGVTPVGYSLTSNLDVPVTSSNLTPTFGGGDFVTTADQTLDFTSDCDLGFTATDLTPTPEPSSLLLLATGLSGLGMVLRRRCFA